MAALATALPSILGSLFGFLGSGRAGKNIADAGNNAVNGLVNATNSGGAAIQGQQGNNEQNVNRAGNAAVSRVDSSTGGANDLLMQILNGQSSNLQPYLAAGAQGAQGLQDYAASKPTFSFNPTMDQLENTPGYQFQLQQGLKATQNSAAGQGLGNSGAALKELTNYGQGMAQNSYQNAFHNAEDTFNTNQNATLANLQALIGTGLQGSSQFNQAQENAGNQVAGNTIGAGLFAGNTSNQLAQFLASLGQQNAQFGADFGQKGAALEGQFGMQGAQGLAAGNMGQASSLGGGAGGISSLLAQLFKSVGSGGSVPGFNPADSGG